MKKVLCMLALVAFATACNNEKKENADPAATAAKTEVKFPFEVGYSKFEPGNPAYAAMILQGSWKDWENGKMDKTNWLADTITAYHSDNTVSKGADSLMARWNRLRASYSASTPAINAIMSVYATEQKENWVLVWADEYDTKLDGTKDTSSVMEAWKINKDGKADLLLQYDRQKRKQ